MKKIPLRRKKQVNDQSPSRITNETVAEHREKVLAGGRKFKYPHQYVRHKLVFNAIIIGVVTVLLAILFGWWQLYKVQTTSDFFYRVTSVIPVPVASVDGENVRYSDYLLRYRSQELWLQKSGQIGLSQEGDKQQLDFFKRKVLDGLEADMYAKKLARDLNITASTEEVQEVIDQSRDTATGQISQDVYDASTQDTLGYSPVEYRRIIRQSLLRQKVAYAVDTEAQDIKKQVQTYLAIKKNAQNGFEAAVKQFKQKGVKLDYGASGSVSKNNRDGGLSRVAVSLKKGEISEPIESTTGDGYYFVQTISQSDTKVNYQYIRIPLSVFEKKFAALTPEEYIDVATVTEDQ